MKLAEWSTYPSHLPYAREIHWPSMEEEGGDYTLLRLVTDDGLVGVAETQVKPTWNSLTQRALDVILEELFIPLIKDVDLADETAVNRALSGVREPRAARALVEAACWDLRAQALGKPMWQIWAGDPEVALSWVLTRQAPALMAQEAATMVSRHGFGTLKVKTGQGREVDRSAVLEIRAAVGPDVQIMVDANGAYPAEEVLDYLKESADLGVTVAEDPCDLLPDRAFEELQKASPIPILVDRGCSGLEAAKLFLERGARELSLKGGMGIREAQRVATLAHGHGCAAHVGSVTVSSLGALAAMQIHSGLPTRSYSLPCEASFFLMFSDDHLVEPLRVQNGSVRLPDQPGQARLIDWEKLESQAPRS